MSGSPGRDVNRRYNVNMGNPAPGFLDRAERALDDMSGPLTTLVYLGFLGHVVKCASCYYEKRHEDASEATADYMGHACLDTDDEQFCRRCLAGVDSSEHAEKCYYPGLAEMGESA